ncbi:hypothetical protein [Salmonella phage GSW6]|uniref:Uncharacterized protein n=1 Tax=Salmonella phage GSW6 TaxID=3025422 RepID=A0AAF0C0G0_9CAUD|nr:hypothetical protein [Salmonella phage GSW6]
MLDFEDDDKEAFYTKPAVNLLGTVLFQVKFYLRNDTTEVVNAIVPEFFVNKFQADLKSFIEDVYDGADLHNAESIYDVFRSLPELDFDIELIESGEIIWALNVPVAGFPGWLQGYEL